MRELKEETGLTLAPLTVDEMFERPGFTTVGMTDESCATVYGYASGQVTCQGQEDSEEIEIVLADRREAARILKEERVAIMCAYMLMHFWATKIRLDFFQELRNSCSCFRHSGQMRNAFFNKEFEKHNQI